jgi:hypothetical protein
MAEREELGAGSLKFQVASIHLQREEFREATQALPLLTPLCLPHTITPKTHHPV